MILVTSSERTVVVLETKTDRAWRYIIPTDGWSQTIRYHGGVWLFAESNSVPETVKEIVKTHLNDRKSNVVNINKPIDNEHK